MTESVRQSTSSLHTSDKDAISAGPRPTDFSIADMPPSTECSSIQADSSNKLDAHEIIQKSLGDGSSVMISSVAVSDIISTLFVIASRWLKPDGRLVFFAPQRHARDLSLTAPSNREELNILSTTSGTQVNALIDAGKNAKRKAFKTQRKKAQQNTVQHQQHHMNQNQSEKVHGEVDIEVFSAECDHDQGLQLTSVLEVTTASKCLYGVDTNETPNPLSRNLTSTICKQDLSNTPVDSLAYLPPIPSDLILIESHRQMLSPTFSRWLCVMEKKKTP
jgi:hypothetical protein